MTKEELEELKSLELEQLRQEKNMREEEDRLRKSKQTDNKIIGMALGICAAIFAVIIIGIMVMTEFMY